MRQFFFFFRLDTGEDQRISKEEFTDDSVKKTIETVSFSSPCLSSLLFGFKLILLISGLDRLMTWRLNLTRLTGAVRKIMPFIIIYWFYDGKCTFVWFQQWWRTNSLLRVCGLGLGEKPRPWRWHRRRLNILVVAPTMTFISYPFRLNSLNLG